MNGWRCLSTSSTCEKSERRREAKNPFTGGYLVFGDARGGAWLTLEKRTVVWHEGKARSGGMTLRALLQPRTMRALGR